MPKLAAFLKTKFFHPQPTLDFVERKSLHPKFKKMRSVPIMLVSASTGYGKSTLVANYFSQSDKRCAWLSLSSKENEINEFIQYFIKAIQTQAPDIGNDILELALAPEPPSSIELAEMLVNSLAELDEYLFLALDDYHLIREKEIHEFMFKLFEYPQPFFRIIIITRRDPVLPLSTWRNKNILVEIRSSDLKFNTEEIAEFYEKATSYHLEKQIVAKLKEITDGWVSGLRMLSLSNNNKEEFQEQIAHFQFKNSRVIRELVETILNNQTKDVREKLLKLSILKEFNADLFAKICLKDDEKSDKHQLFSQFCIEIIHSNLFIIALDDKHQWYRFHHLFKDTMFEILSSEKSKTEINELRIQAADWLSSHGFKEEAIEYYISANVLSKAIEIFIDFRLELMSASRFKKLEIVLNYFPKKVIEEKGVLQITKAWIILLKGNIPEMAKYIEPLEQSIKQEQYAKDTEEVLLGELHSMMAFDHFLSNVDLNACLIHSKKSIELLKGRNPYALGVSWVYYGASLHHLNQAAKARIDIYSELENTSDDNLLRFYLLMMLCFMDWFDGKLSDLLHSAEHLLEYGNRTSIKMAIASGNILKAMAYYYQNNDEKAIDYLLKSNELRQYVYAHMGFAAGMALADIYAKNERIEEKEEILNAYEKSALRNGGKLFLNIVKSSESVFRWRYENDLSGLKWAKENDYKNFIPFANLHSPELVQATILVTDNNPASQQLALNITNDTISYFGDRNDSNVLVRSYVIQALAYFNLGNSKEAYATLKKVTAITSLGSYIRPYIELGKPMKKLLLAYQKADRNSTHIENILQYFSNGKSDNEQIVLSEREKEILILAKKLTNKEVGNQLFISEKTVKTHITNINKKLSVASKIDAIVKAKQLELI